MEGALLFLIGGRSFFFVLSVCGYPVKVFASSPVRVFEGHKSDVVDLSWSHSDFLCSASIDHTIMLWHPHRCDP